MYQLSNFDDGLTRVSEVEQKQDGKLLALLSVVTAVAVIITLYWLVSFWVSYL